MATAEHNLTPSEIVGLADRTSDAYSYDRYKNWNAVAKKLLAHGFTEREAEAIMRSKWMRWAADATGKYDNIPANAIIKYIGTMTEAQLRIELAELVEGTFNGR